jgi:hypothetical protein
MICYLVKDKQKISRQVFKKQQEPNTIKVNAEWLPMAAA